MVRVFCGRGAAIFLLFVFDMSGIVGDLFLVLLVRRGHHRVGLLPFSPALPPFRLTSGYSAFRRCRANVVMSVSPERRKSRKSTPRYLPLSHTLRSVSTSSMPF